MSNLGVPEKKNTAERNQNRGKREKPHDGCNVDSYLDARLNYHAIGVGNESPESAME